MRRSGLASVKMYRVNNSLDHKAHLPLRKEMMTTSSPYPDDSTFTRFPITFEVELLTPQQVAEAQRKAAAASTEEGTN